MFEDEPTAKRERGSALTMVYTYSVHCTCTRPIWELAIQTIGVTTDLQISRSNSFFKDTLSKVRINHLRVLSDVLHVESVLCFFL